MRFFVAMPFPPLLVCKLGGTQQVVEFSSWTAFLRLFLLPGADVRSFEGDASDIVRRFAKNFRGPPAYPAAGSYLCTGDSLNSRGKNLQNLILWGMGWGLEEGRKHDVT